MLTSLVAASSAIAAYLLRKRRIAALQDGAAIDDAIALRASAIALKSHFRAMTYNVLADGPRYAMSQCVCCITWHIILV
jgi:hypothetical protein